MNGWFPRLSRSGVIASGQGEVFVEDRLLMPVGYKPQWFDEDHLVAMGPDDALFLVNVHTGATEFLTGQVPGHVFTAGARKWAVCFPDEIALSLDPVTGRLARTTETGGENKDRSLFVGDVPIIEHAAIEPDARLVDDFLVWTGGYPDAGVYGVDLRGSHGYRSLRLTPPGTWQGRPVAVRTVEGVWLVWITNVDIRLHPVDQREGFVIRTGEDRNFNPDACAIDGGRGIRVVWQDKHGNRDSRDFSLGEGREDVTFAIGAQPDPVDPDPVEPEPDPMPDMSFPDNVRPILARYVAAFPVPQGEPGDAFEERVRQWTIRFAEQVCYELPHQGFGMKRADRNRPISKDTLTRLADGRMVAWDLLLGSGTGKPVLSAQPEAHDVTDQVFVPSLPVNHLGAAGPGPGDENDAKTHPYERDDDERDECNRIMPDGSQCDQPRAAAIHQVAKPDDPKPAPSNDWQRDMLAESRKQTALLERIAEARE